MADSSAIQIPAANETELKQLNQSPKPVATSSASTAVVDKTLSSAANIVKLLPSGTVLAFQVLSPSFANKGTCYTTNKCLTAILIFLCSVSCVFFSFTDSLVGRDGKIYYGLATFKGFYAFNFDGSEEQKSRVFSDLKKMRIRKIDFVHAVFSVMVLLTMVFSDSDIQSCFFPAAGKQAKELLVNLPLGAGFLSSLVFMIFPTARKGIGYSDATPHEKQ